MVRAYPTTHDQRQAMQRLLALMGVELEFPAIWSICDDHAASGGKLEEQIDSAVVVDVPCMFCAMEEG